MTPVSKLGLSKLGLSLVTLAALGLAATSPVQAQQTSSPNLFAGKTATATNPFPNATLGVAGNLTDGATTPYVFGDNTNPEIASITGFNSAIDTLRFFDSPDFNFSRLSPSVIVGYSSVASAGLTPASYTLLNGGAPLALATSNSGNDYLTATTPSQFQTGPASNNGAGPNPIHFSDLTGLNIPTGTQSVLLEFTVATDPNGSFGSSITEIQGFAPVPEASTTVGFGLMLGLGALAFAARRRTKV